MMHARSNSRITSVAQAAVATLFIACTFTSARAGDEKPTGTGAIKATLKTEAHISHCFALVRESTKTGLKTVRYEGHIDGSKLLVEHLPVPATVDLLFETTGGDVEGWDASVPRSEYEIEQPLAPESISALKHKTAPEANTGFDDEVWMLDIQGNIANAAVLTTHLRRRPFIESAGENRSQWIWRVARWQWENPTDASWVPWKEMPYYALDRKRMLPEEFKALNMTYARHLGGIHLSNEKNSVDLGQIIVPAPGTGIIAVNPDGSRIEPVRIKPPAANPSATQPAAQSKLEGAQP